MAKEKFERTTGRIDAPVGKGQYIEGWPAYKPTTSQVNKLRSLTGEGVMECKEALIEAKGNEQAAVEILKRKGLAKAIELSGRSANEGCVLSKTSSDHKFGVIIKLSCESDFVANTPGFVKLAQDIVDKAVAKRVKKYDSLLSSTINGNTVKELIANQSSITEEKVELERFEVLEGAYVGNYNHLGNRLATIVEMNMPFDKGPEYVKEVCLQIAATSPSSVESLHNLQLEGGRQTVGDYLSHYNQSAKVVRFYRIGISSHKNNDTFVTIPDNPAKPNSPNPNNSDVQNQQTGGKKNKKKDKKEDLTDLLPIKGISIAMKKALNKKCNIYDIPGLLCNGVFWPIGRS